MPALKKFILLFRVRARGSGSGISSSGSWDAIFGAVIAILQRQDIVKIVKGRMVIAAFKGQRFPPNTNGFPILFPRSN
jgi:uncharacterized cupin superfamily protein